MNLPSLEEVVIPVLYVGFSVGWMLVRHRQNRVAWTYLSLLVNVLLVAGLILAMRSGFD